MTIREISILSGYSVSTVSKALNNKTDISEGTKTMIKRIAKEHNYVPNKYAVALRKKRIQLIAVILPKVNMSIFSDSLYIIQKNAADFGYRVMIYQSFNQDNIEREYIQTINDGSVDGIIVMSEDGKPTTAYTSINNLPIESISVTNTLSEQQLNNECVNGFSRLLNKIIMQ